MKLIIYNGSPRGRKSNTGLLMNEFVKGMYKEEEYDVYIYYLASRSDRIAGVEAFQDAENVILAFPLYTDSMPGLVKEFIEMLEPYTTSQNNPAIGYVVQSGFPEAAHSRYVESYLEKLTKRFNTAYLGTVIRGGVEGIQIMPPAWTRRLYSRFQGLGRHFARKGQFDEKIVKKLASTEQFSWFRILMFKLMKKTGMSNFYWNGQMKENGVLSISYDKPYIAVE